MNVFTYKSLTIVTATALFATVLPGCWVKKTMCRGLHSVMGGTCKTPADDGTKDESGGGVISGAGQPASAMTPAVTPVAPGFALSRIQPEQLSNNLELIANVGQDFRVANNDVGQTLDYLVASYGVPLGGVDFVASSRRDPTTKAQTLLVARVLASQFGSWAVWKDWGLPAGQRVIFTRCDMAKDRPTLDSELQLPLDQQLLARASESRWSDQVDELFWRFFSRPPTTAEKAAVRAAFVTSFTLEGYTQAAWVTVLYALMGAEEFWHV